jgi:hypothetical protein
MLGKPNKPLEWTGHRRVGFHRNSSLPATQGQRWAVSQGRGMRESRERGYNVRTSAGCGRGTSEAGQNRQLERGASR